MIECAALVGGVAIILTALGYGYKVKMDRKSIMLEKNDLEHQRKHLVNEARIKELESFKEASQKKNGYEQHQIDELKRKFSELEKRCEKECKKEKNYGNRS